MSVASFRSCSINEDKVDLWTLSSLFSQIGICDVSVQVLASVVDTLLDELLDEEGTSISTK